MITNAIPRAAPFLFLFRAIQIVMQKRNKVRVLFLVCRGRLARVYVVPNGFGSFCGCLGFSLLGVVSVGFNRLGFVCPALVSGAMSWFQMRRVVSDALGCCQLPWGSFSCPGLFSSPHRSFQIPWRGVSCPGVTSAALGRFRLPKDGFRCIAGVAAAIGWFQLPWGGCCCLRMA